MSEGLFELTTRFALLDKARIDTGLSAAEQAEWLEIKREIVRSLNSDVPFDIEDRRGTVRVDMQLAVYFPDAEGFDQAYVKNVSDGGMLIESNRPLTVGDQISLVVHVGEPYRTVEARVEVVWVSSPPARGAGVRFVELTPGGRTAINEIIHAALAKKAKQKE